MKTLPSPFATALLAGGLVLSVVVGLSGCRQPPQLASSPTKTSQHSEEGQASADAKVTFHVNGMKKTQSGAT